MKISKIQNVDIDTIHIIFEDNITLEIHTYGKRLVFDTYQWYSSAEVHKYYDYYKKDVDRFNREQKLERIVNEPADI